MMCKLKGLCAQIRVHGLNSMERAMTNTELQSADTPESSEDYGQETQYSSDSLGTINLHDMPDLVFVHICSYLDYIPDVLCGLSLTCKKLND